MTPAARRATYQDVLDAPPHVTAEVIDGELHLQPKPAPPHVYVESSLQGNLWELDRRSGGNGPRGWIFHAEPELHFGQGDIVVPDLAGWRVERYEPPVGNFWTQAPDWCCEILSPHEPAPPLKSGIYRREGVSFFWLVHATELWILAFEHSDDSCWKVIGVFQDEAPVRIKPFDAIELPIAKLWGR